MKCLEIPRKVCASCKESPKKGNLWNAHDMPRHSYEILCIMQGKSWENQGNLWNVHEIPRKCCAPWKENPDKKTGTFVQCPWTSWKYLGKSCIMQGKSWNSSETGLTSRVCGSSQEIGRHILQSQAVSHPCDSYTFLASRLHIQNSAALLLTK